MLTPVEDFWLRWHVEHSTIELAEQARLVLEAETGGSVGQVAANLGLSPQTVEGVLAQFEHDGLATFPRPSLKLEQLVVLKAQDSAKRRHVAHLARRLFNDTRPLHHLPRKARQLLEAAALLPPMTRPTNGTNGNGAAERDIDLLDGAVISDYEDQEQATLKCVLHLQQKGYRADRDPLFRRLRQAEQSQVRYLAALLQLAEQLDHSGTQSTNLEAVELQDEIAVLRVSGPKARVDGTFARQKATLWQPVFHLALELALGPRPKTANPPRPNGASKENDFRVGDVFARQLSAALRKWQASLPGAASGEVAGMADLLAAVSEAQAAFGAFASVLKRQPLKQVKRPLRIIHAHLAAGIAQKYAENDLETYCSGRPQATLADLQALREAWERTSKREQHDLKSLLESPEAVRLYIELSALAKAPPVRHGKSTSFRAAASVLLDELCAEVAEREERVVADRPKTYRRYQQGLARLATALEALQSPLGAASQNEEADRLLADIRRMEGRIDRWLASSAINDAIAEFLDTWAEQQARRKAPQLFGAQSVLAYRQARRAQWSRIRSSLPTEWRPVRASRLRRRINSLLKQLERH